jgi:alpha-mannosidase
VADLPPLRYRVYRVVKTAEAPPAPASDAGAPALLWGDMPEEPSAWLENDRFRLEIARETGHIARLYDKRAGVEVFRGEAARPVVIDDPSDTWAHGVWQFDDVIGEFAATRVRLVEHGPVKATLRVESEYGASRLVQDFTLYGDLDIIEVRASVDWRERHKLLKPRFPANLKLTRATYEIPYGHIERAANGEEEPGQS